LLTERIHKIKITYSRSAHA